MSFSKHIETAIGWNNLDDWKPILFRDLTVEPIPTAAEYKKVMPWCAKDGHRPEMRQEHFSAAVFKQFLYHYIRKKG